MFCRYPCFGRGEDFVWDDHMTAIGEKIKLMLSNEPGLRLAILFGSMAHGRAHADSDIDLALLFDENIEAEKMMRLIEMLSVEFGRPVDIIDVRAAGILIMAEVFKGERLLGDDDTFAQRLSQHLIDVDDFMPLLNRILEKRRKTWLQ